jgi:hypothetical protein
MELELDFPEIDIEEINFDDFSDLEINLNFEFDSRYIKPPRVSEISPKLIKYAYAEKLAKDIDIVKNSEFHVISNGTFIFGDFIEALIVEKNYHVKKMTISTLSLSQNNVDSLFNLINGDYLDELNLIVSTHFFSHERHDLIKYIYETIDINDIFQLAVCRTHCKLCIIETHCGLKIVIHGSANLRTSGNIEQFAIQESPDLYNWHDEYQDRILERFSTINKSIERKETWQLINQEVTKKEKVREKVREKVKKPLPQRREKSQKEETTMDRNESIPF